ncbi:deoxyguanosinetriphosphate triphosphohydrolase [Microbacterium sp. MPKO10]|uniref:deoxyguanosinetriphosphate triphosphohydrolase n=1 Tax=Microbacterium sp. MPKO10 TaxID=2989818 RepID=UPI0022359A83|nr:deoxyguanosinetriphosphate triphosphohydrolase [Microbacterium sp. MPKO10]MCW4459639.1 deoxyguanosinetriphosphate triphosphohydrolase [Microbacterium sp. MPKO10]
MAVDVYNAHDQARWLPEHHTSRRSDFARDRARLVHSSALRRLAAKTQVLSPTSGVDFARNRLTHSLEVAQVGRELAASLALAPDVVDTACLAHDIGHPPFGHNGEKALNEWALDVGGFEGNAQTLRVLTRLEPKVFDADGTPYGLNLTRASLDASCKYPWPAAHATADPSGRAKFGFFDDDTRAFEWLRDGAPAEQRCIEAEVMDLSDDIAYSVHDFEDAIVSEYIDPAFLNAQAGHESLLKAVLAWAGSAFTLDDLGAAFERLSQHPSWPLSWDGSRRDLAGLKDFTSSMIGHFARSATAATQAAYPQRSLIRFGAHVEIPHEIESEIAVLKGVVAAFVMSSDARQPIYRQQREILLALAERLWSSDGAGLDVGFAAEWRVAPSDAVRKRIVVDQIASLTDQGAVALYENRDVVAGVIPRA